MSVTPGPDGTRKIQVDVEVPGTPEQVWRAIASSQGLTAWFMPSELDEHEGGAIRMDFGAGLMDTATITAWDPPRSMTADSHPFGPDGPPCATQWVVEARESGRCVVRVVHSLFAANDDWDDQLEGIESGWPWFFHILRLYLERHVDEPCSLARVSAFTTRAPEEAWDDFVECLGLRVEEGARWSSADGSLAFEAHDVDKETYKSLLASVTVPAPGTLSAFVQPLGPQNLLSVSVYLYGERGAQAAAALEERLQAQLSERFGEAPEEGLSC